MFSVMPSTSKQAVDSRVDGVFQTNKHSLPIDEQEVNNQEGELPSNAHPSPKMLLSLIATSWILIMLLMLP
jgi:hypothetical protein